MIKENAKKLVLIVDDDPQIRKILQRMLQAPEYEVLCAESGKEALEILERVTPHLIILDIMMPGMSGIEVCQHIRKIYPSNAMQVIMLSAKDSQSDRRRALEYGADDYITKPFHIASLARKIEYIFEKKDSAIAS